MSGPKKIPVRKGDFDEDPPTRIVNSQTLSQAKVSNSELPSFVTCLRIKSGLESGKLIPLTPGEWLSGRSNSSNIVLRDADCSRQHAKIIVSGQGRVFLSDLESTNGVFVNKVKVEGTQELKAGDELFFSEKYMFQVERHENSEAEKQSTLYTQATQDALTGAYNRKFFEECFKSLVKEQSGDSQLALILFDADFFKKVNDTYGHAGGDAVLRAIAARTRASLRAEDIFARIGGEEFIVIAQVKSQEMVQVLSERLRVAMSSTPVDFETSKISFTISLGTVFFGSTTCKDFQSVYKIVDAALYKSKESGRNRATHTSF